MSVPELLLLFVPLVLAGTSNMLFVKSERWARLARPIDGGRMLADGRRLFGPNKTWKGAVGMLFFTGFWFAVWGAIALALPALRRAMPLDFERLPNVLALFAFGCLWGVAWIVAELPNSYLKRRLGIAAGKKGSGSLGALFVVIDQLDSMLACALLLPLVSPLGALDVVVFAALGVVVHYLVALGLYAVGLKRQAG